MMPRILFPALALLALSGCSATITVPDESGVAQPRPVFLLEHGWHTSLVLVRPDESMVRFVYGDWRWYAQADTGVLRAIPTLFARTRGALGRQQLSPPATPQTIRANSRVVIDEIHEFTVRAERVDALVDALESRFDQARDTLVYSSLYDLEFVHDPKPYTLGDNSNHVVADWLDELGIEVRGNPVYGRWQLN